MGEERSAKAVVDTLSDDYAWRILAATSAEDRSAEELADICDADPSTIYRRLENLDEADLVEPSQQIDPDGHHYKTYRANLEAVHVFLEADGFRVDVDHREDPSDRFTRLYEGLK